MNYFDFRPKRVLLGDIGATNARFAHLSDGALGPIRNFSVADFSDFKDVVSTFLDGDDQSVTGHEAVFAIAGPSMEDGVFLQTARGLSIGTSLGRHSVSHRSAFATISRPSHGRCRI
jgi:glucokinase